MKIQSLNTNQYYEAISGIYSLKEQLYLLDLKVYRWKWIIVILHNCVQNFMICCLTSSNYLDVLTKVSSQKWYKYLLEQLHRRPQVRLDSCINLFDRIYKSSIIQKRESDLFSSLEDYRLAIRNLNDLRNKFIHFIPQEWTLVIAGLPIMALRIIRIIEYLGHESEKFRWRNVGEKDMCNNLITEIKINLYQLNESYK